VIYFRGFSRELSVSLPTDDEGYIGRECPKCKRYFKVVPGTGYKHAETCQCPYCGHRAEPSKFATGDQIGYAKYIATVSLCKQFAEKLKELECDIEPRGLFGIGLSIRVTQKPMIPVYGYWERELETHIECSNCALKYAVYGVFAFCPDCGQHNSLQILNKNLELVLKMLEMASSAESSEIGERLIENALEDCVSSFDGFGREIYRVYLQGLHGTDEAKKLSFQNLENARKRIAELSGIDISSPLTVDEWQAAVRLFQKRHLIAHKMGVVDREYILNSGDKSIEIGRKIKISREEIEQIVNVLRKIAEYLYASLQRIANDG